MLIRASTQHFAGRVSMVLKVHIPEESTIGDMHDDDKLSDTPLY